MPRPLGSSSSAQTGPWWFSSTLTGEDGPLISLQMRTIATSSSTPATGLHIPCQGHLICSSGSTSVGGFQTSLLHNALLVTLLPAGGQSAISYTAEKCYRPRAALGARSEPRMMTQCRSRAGLSPSSPSPAQHRHSPRFASTTADTLSCNSGEPGVVEAARG